MAYPVRTVKWIARKMGERSAFQRIAPERARGQRPGLCVPRLLAAGLVLFCALLPAQNSPGNRPERLERFRDLGFGMFIHWGVDVSLGTVISHSLVGASPDYVERYYRILPGLFHPDRFNPSDWAELAKLAGMKYVVFTARHHSGFCMWDTATSRLNVMNTPFHRDVVAEVVKAFRAQGIAVGIYLSPDDFYWFHENGYPIARPPAPRTTTKELPGLLAYDQAQLKELLTHYGPIDFLFIDGPADGLTDYAWKLNPDLVVTRGAIETPEQTVPGVPLDKPWESCITMGTSWQYKPTNEEYKSGAELIDTLIEIRAKGGNLLLNVGPMPDGELAPEQAGRLREIALWNFVNGESIDTVRPWVLTNEGNIWFTRKKTEPTVYAFVTREHWRLGERKTFTLRSVRATSGTQVSVLGESGEILEYQPGVIPKTTWKQDDQGLHISAWRTQRLYNNRRWPNPTVLKITHAEPALQPPQFSTGDARWDAASGCYELGGELKSLGDASSVDVSFQYRPARADLYEAVAPWKDLPFTRQSAPGPFRQCLVGVPKGSHYEFRAVLKHPVMTLFGAGKPVDRGAVRLP